MNILEEKEYFFTHVDIKDWTHGIDTPVLVRCIKGKSTLGWKHYHEFHELTIIMNGQGEYNYQGSTYHLQPGDAYITPPMVKHQYTQQQALELFNFIWYPQEMPLPFSALESIPCFRVFFDLEPRSRHNFSFSQRLTLSPSQLSEVRVYYLRMKNELEEHQEGFTTRLSCILYELLIQLCRWYSSHQDSANNGELMRIEKAVNYLEMHYMERITRPELARICAYSDCSFAKKFKKTMGETFGEYLMKLRLNHARQELLATEKSLGEIAMDCGFCDSNYLCLVFRRKFGISPHQFRLNKRM